MSGDDGRERERETTLELELAGSRYKHLLWAIVGLGVGLAVALHMGSIGWAIGGLVAAGGASSAWAFVRTLLHTPGTIAVRDDVIVLPVGVSSGKEASLPPAELRHAYVLRRALPWNQSTPVLVVETKRGVYEFPREWFGGESDQRRVAAALNRRLGRIP